MLLATESNQSFFETFASSTSGTKRTSLLKRTFADYGSKLPIMIPFNVSCVTLHLLSF